MMSVVPPGAYGTTSLIGFDGKACCAPALAATAQNRAAVR
jgi:hypothetical protein